MAGCSPLHKNMPAGLADVASIEKFKPVFQSDLYQATIDVVGNHLSGLLLIKKMPDSSTRLVFSNEMGVSFFDFEFAANGDFKVLSVMKKLDKRSVIKTLQHDFELVLMQNLKGPKATVKSSGDLVYFIFPQSKGFNYYITNSSGNELLRMERASNKKVIVEAIMKDLTGPSLKPQGAPDTIGISHKTFEFNIGLRKIQR
jgi:hypothetical protein